MKKTMNKINLSNNKKRERKRKKKESLQVRKHSRKKKIMNVKYSLEIYRFQRLKMSYLSNLENKVKSTL